MIGVGIIGASVGGSWGSTSHIPAVQSLDGMRVAAVATSRMESAKASAEHYGIPHAFDDPFLMASHPDVDLVTIAVRVPEHDRLVRAALRVGKDVYCEWPLARDTHEAVGLRDAAAAAGVRTIIGLQSQVNPVINHVKNLVADGYIGELIATTMIHSGPWVAGGPSSMSYLQTLESGANFLTIRAGHSLDALCYSLGDFDHVVATSATQVPHISETDTGKMVLRTSPDQLVISGRLRNGAVAAVHMQGGPARGAGIRWEISGTERDLLVVAPAGTPSIQIAPFLSLLEVPNKGDPTPLLVPGVADGPEGHVYHLGPVGGVTRMYAGFRDGQRVPDFAAAVCRHELLDIVMMAAESGKRQRGAA
jgi:predicted dehydrogenase